MAIRRQLNPKFLGWNYPKVDLNDKTVFALDDNKQVVNWKRKRRKIQLKIRYSKKLLKVKKWRFKLKRSTHPAVKMSTESENTDNFFEEFNTQIDSEFTQSLLTHIPSVIESCVIQSDVPALVRMKV